MIQSQEGQTLLCLSPDPADAEKPPPAFAVCLP